MNKLSEQFNSKVGIRQGDNLKPNLFKVFINDLPDIFHPECDPVSLGNKNLNCLLYADDVILLSRSKLGLQNCLQELQEFCEKTFRN